MNWSKVNRAVFNTEIERYRSVYGQIDVNTTDLTTYTVDNIVFALSKGNTYYIKVGADFVVEKMIATLNTLFGTPVVDGKYVLLDIVERIGGTVVEAQKNCVVIDDNLTFHLNPQNNAIGLAELLVKYVLNSNSKGAFTVDGKNNPIINASAVGWLYPYADFALAFEDLKLLCIKYPLTETEIFEILVYHGLIKETRLRTVSKSVFEEHTFAVAAIKRNCGDYTCHLYFDMGRIIGESHVYALDCLNKYFLENNYRYRT